MENALHRYRRGFWTARKLNESDPSFDLNDPNNIELFFDKDSMCHTEYAVITAFVNWEARSIALGWIRRHGLVCCKPRDEDATLPIFKRPHDPMHDTLYVPLNMLGAFHGEPYDRMTESDLEGVILNANTSSVDRLAIDTELIHRTGWSTELLEWFRNVEELLIVVNHTSNPSASHSYALPYEHLPVLSHRWDSLTGKFEIMGTADDQHCEWLPESFQELQEELQRTGCQKLTVRGVSSPLS